MSHKRIRNEEVIDENISKSKRMCSEKKSMKVVVDEKKLADSTSVPTRGKKMEIETVRIYCFSLFSMFFSRI